MLLLLQLSKKSFPLCMQQLHAALRSNHHLRHGGRQQYGLFLKGIGLSLEEAVKFWRSEFTKIIDGDQVGCRVVVVVRVRSVSLQSALNIHGKAILVVYTSAVS